MHFLFLLEVGLILSAAVELNYFNGNYLDKLVYNLRINFWKLAKCVKILWFPSLSGVTFYWLVLCIFLIFQMYLLIDIELYVYELL